MGWVQIIFCLAVGMNYCLLEDLSDVCISRLADDPTLLSTKIGHFAFQLYSQGGKGGTIPLNECLRRGINNANGEAAD